MKKIALLFLLIAAFAFLAGCMGPYMHGDHGDDYRDRYDRGYSRGHGH